MTKEWVVYLLRCSDGSLYCGITNNLKNRIATHRKGQGAKYTRSRIPIELVGISSKMDKSDALKLEYRVKQMPAGKKIIELSKTEEILATDFKSALKELKNEFRKLGKQVEKLTKAFEKAQEAEKKPTKPKVKTGKPKAATPKSKRTAKKKSAKTVKKQKS